jgi:hypothetical protein
MKQEEQNPFVLLAIMVRASMMYQGAVLFTPARTMLGSGMRVTPIMAEFRSAPAANDP